MHAAKREQDVKKMSMLVSLLFIVLAVPVKGQNEIHFDKPVLIEKSDVPELPRMIRKSNAKGIALIKVDVGDTGLTEDIQPVRSTGLKALDAFLISWIRDWKFLPKISGDETVDGFTIISIRYDLSENRFEAPPVNELTMTLPEAYQRLLSEDSPASVSGETEVVNDSLDIQPLLDIRITKIPPEIQNRNIVAGTALNFVVNSSGEVVSIERPRAIEDDIVWDWLVKQFQQSLWPTDTEHSRRRLVIPLVMDTSVCKFDFGDAQLAK